MDVIAQSCYNLSTQVRESIMATLAAVQLEDLPVVVKFILHSVSASDVLEVRAPESTAFCI